MLCLLSVLSQISRTHLRGDNYGLPQNEYFSPGITLAIRILRDTGAHGGVAKFEKPTFSVCNVSTYCQQI